jgi:hypothetical protein
LQPRFVLLDHPEHNAEWGLQKVSSRYAAWSCSFSSAAPQRRRFFFRGDFIPFLPSACEEILERSQRRKDASREAARVVLTTRF